MQHWLAIFILLAQILNPVAHAMSLQADPEITDLGAEAFFGEYITFHVQVDPLDDVKELLVFISPESQSTVWQTVALDEADATGEISTQVDVRQLALYPFTKISYRYQATLNDGSKVQGGEGSFQYDDSRFLWQTQESGIFQIHWYGSDSTLGQMIANIAEESLGETQKLLSIDPPDPLRIYAYTSSDDLQSALQLTSQPWVAGHATPELSMILISVPSGPEKELELQRQIPHEIMHILQYHALGEDMSRQPVWLMEGMASLVEIYPNPEYRSVLQTTASAGNLVPFRSLCDTFPREAAGAFQAYAQSESFVRFLYTKYGASGLQRLMEQYQNGLGCEEGFSAALEVSLQQAEYRWQQETLGINMGGLVLSNLSPYLLVGLLILVSASLAFLPYRAKAKSAGKSI